MKTKFWSPVAGVLLMAMLALAACSGGTVPTSTQAPSAATVAPTAESQPTQAMQPTETAVEGQIAQPTAATEPQPTDTAKPAQAPEPTQAPELTAEPTSAPFTPRTELEATDPATVQLASGNVQLVEFFAFW